jgi:uncharacterized membrane protein
MSPQLSGLIVGGLLPALFFGLSGVFARPATQAGISTGFYLTIIGLAAATVGLVFCLIFPERELTFRSGLFTILVGSTWAIAAGLVAIALTKYGSPISRLVPLYNLNTLVAVIIGLVVFSEWREVNALQLLIGAVLIIVGGSLVATS